jgi:hypothetical protein
MNHRFGGYEMNNLAWYEHIDRINERLAPHGFRVPNTSLDKVHQNLLVIYSEIAPGKAAGHRLRLVNALRNICSADSPASEFQQMIAVHLIRSITGKWPRRRNVANGPVPDENALLILLYETLNEVLEVLP